MPKRVLFINEFGSGLTHFNTLRSAYERIRQVMPIDGQFYVAAVEELKASGFHDAPVHGVPHLSIPKTKRLGLSRTYGEVVFSSVFIKRERSSEWFAWWDKELKAYNPDLIVIDYAPVAQMVAYGRWPVLCMGYGYTIPPPTMKTFMAFGKEAPKPKEETQIMLRFNEELRKIGARQLSKLPDMCAADKHINATIPPLDPYLDFRGEQAHAGIYHPGGSPWPKPQHEGALVYLHAFSQQDAGLLDALKLTGLETDFYAGAPSEEVIARFAGSRVTAHAKPFILKDMLPGKAVCVHMGGLGVTSAALFAGVPQVFFHTHKENKFNANMVVMQGAGIALALRSVTKESAAAAILEAANDQAMRQRAFNMGRLVAQYRDADPIGVLVKEAVAMLA